MTRTWIRPILCTLVLSGSAFLATPAAADDTEIRRLLAALDEAKAKLEEVNIAIDEGRQMLVRLARTMERLQELYIETGEERYKHQLDDVMRQYTNQVEQVRALIVERTQIERWIATIEAQLRRLGVRI